MSYFGGSGSVLRDNDTLLIPNGGIQASQQLHLNVKRFIEYEGSVGSTSQNALLPAVLDHLI